MLKGTKRMLKGNTLGQKLFAVGAIVQSLLLIYVLYVSNLDIGRLAAVSGFVWGIGAQITKPLEWRKREHDTETNRCFGIEKRKT